MIGRYAERSIDQGYVMLSKYRSSALCAFFVLSALVVSACGGGVPGNSVARIGDQTIKKSTFDHWMRIAAVSQQSQTNPNQSGAPKVVVPDAPDYTKCIANKKATAPKPGKGVPEPTQSQLKGQCQQEYNALRDQVLEFLIRGNWIEQETSKQKVKVSNKEVQSQIDAAVKQAFQDPKQFQQFLVRSGLTQADVFYQQRNQLLQQKLTEKVTKASGKITDAQIQAYYDKNKSKFATPEHRSLRIVLTKQQSRAQQAKRALQSGQSWKSVTKRFSIDQASKAQGGLLSNVAKGQQEKALDDAIFKAQKGKLTGPVKTQFGYYVLEVTKITPAKQQSLAQSKSSIQQILQSDGQRKALDKFGKDYRKRWRAETTCRKGFTTADCKNGPKTQSTATATAQQQAPQTTTTQP
jgi:parvulin-like peptidyl-prolyl isomerase